MKRIFGSTIVVVLFAGFFALNLAYPRNQSNRRASLDPAVQAQEAERAIARDDENAVNAPQSGPCTLSSVSGKYAILIQGTLLPPNVPMPTPGVAVGWIELDATGNVTGADTLSLGGQITPRTYSGTFTIKPDCTFTSRLTVLSGLPGLIITSSGVIVDGGRELQFVETDPNTIFTAVAKRL